MANVLNDIASPAKKWQESFQWHVRRDCLERCHENLGTSYRRHIWSPTVFCAGIALLAALWLAGAEWLSLTVYPWINVINELVFGVCLLIFLPLAIVPATRLVSGIGLFISSYLFGFTLWVMSFLVAYILWGVGGLIVGLFLFGLGVVPIALLASLFHAEWATLVQLILALILVVGTRILGLYLVQKAEESASSVDPIVVE